MAQAGTAPPAVGSLEDREAQRIQAMMGNTKNQEAKYVVGQTGQKETFGEGSHTPNATVYFKNCSDCEYVLDAYCTKVFVESCKNTTIVLNKKIITNTVDVWRCENVTLRINTDVGTLQTDMCKGLDLDVHHTDALKTLVWAGVHDMKLSYRNTDEHKLHTGFEQMKEQLGSKYPNLSEQTDQFITRFVNGKLLTELIVRLQNGYPTTQREADEFDRRQEELVQRLAKEAGITINKKKPAGPKIKPNEPCTCNSGKKYKKCCGQGKM